MRRNRNGFTLVELMVVILILGILASIALPKFAALRDRARLATLRSDLGNAELAEESYYTNTGVYASLAQLQADGLMRLSPNTDMVITGSTMGYEVTATNNTIDAATKSCSVRVGAGNPQSTDGVITCP